MSLFLKAMAASHDVGLPRPMSDEQKDLHQLLSTIEDIYHIKDLDSLLERVLLEARRFVHADAGTIFLTSDSQLHFSYVQNDTLFRSAGSKNRYIYSSASLPLDRNSIAGYVGLTGESLLIDDVYDIRSDVSYSFNPAFDDQSNYRTRSILGVPLITRDDVVVGVLQLINAKDEGGNVIPFSMQDRLYITQFARSAANAIEKAKISRDMILRLVEMVELRDPYETGQHVKRVGAYSVEMYEAWARRRNIPERDIQDTKDALRTAAILHDIGKVAVSDIILRKPSQLTYYERQQVNYHTIYGARLFSNINSSYDQMAMDVALNHHERWDGKGYPGRVLDIHALDVKFGAGKRETEIPLAARIVSLTDIYDALLSQRSYKRSWKEDEVLRFIRTQSGRIFDPELARIFLATHDVFRAIRSRYPD
jgi:HD-GYP domain-containing protein (c-di-GMP phosphodiesterase class II)